jgi:probable HAF family extracellular repeat protein
MKRMIRSLRRTGGAGSFYARSPAPCRGTHQRPTTPSSQGGGAKRKRDRDRLTFTQIDFPGATTTNPFRINNRGQIVGSFVDAAGVLHGFLLDDGAFTSTYPPGPTGTEAVGITIAARSWAMSSTPTAYSMAFC